MIECIDDLGEMTYREKLAQQLGSLQALITAMRMSEMTGMPMEKCVNVGGSAHQDALVLLQTPVDEGGIVDVKEMKELATEKVEALVAAAREKAKAAAANPLELVGGSDVKH